MNERAWKELERVKREGKWYKWSIWMKFSSPHSTRRCYASFQRKETGHESEGERRRVYGTVWRKKRKRWNVLTISKINNKKTCFNQPVTWSSYSITVTLPETRNIFTQRQQHKISVTCIYKIKTLEIVSHH